MELQLILVLLAVAFAAFVKGFVGFGFPLISVPMLALLVDPKTAVIVVSIPTIFSNLVVLMQGEVPWAPLRRALPFMVPLVAAAVLGASLLPHLDPRWLAAVIGVISVVFSLLSLVRVKLTLAPRQERLASPAMGALCGLLGGATTIYGPLVALYFQTLRYDKWPFVYVLSVIFLAGTLAQNATYAALHLYRPDVVLYGVLACLPMLVGLQLGVWAQRRAALPYFEYAVLVVVLLSTAHRKSSDGWPGVRASLYRPRNSARRPEDVGTA
jgi:uncharacterized membrane protein YfcA